MARRPVLDEQELAAEKSSQRKRQSVVLGVIVVLLGVCGIFIHYVGLQAAQRAPVPLQNTAAFEEATQVSNAAPAESFSFADIFADRAAHDGERVSLGGHLEHSVESGIHVYSLRDDKGLRINLKRFTRAQQALFVENGVTVEPYTVDGILKRTYDGFDLIVDRIEPR